VMPRQSGRYSSLLRVLDGNIAGGCGSYVRWHGFLFALCMLN